MGTSLDWDRIAKELGAGCRGKVKLQGYVFVFAALLCAQGFVHAQDNPQKLFEALEKKLTEAKVMKFEFDVEAKDSNGAISMKGTIILNRDNRMRLVFEGPVADKQSKTTWISDGSKMNIKTELSGKTSDAVRDTPERLNQIVLGCLTRACLVTGTNSIARPKPLDPAVLKPGNFKLLAKEKIGERVANVLEFESATPGASAFNNKLWLDAETGVPLKRVTQFGRDGQVSLTSTETYHHWDFDPKLAKDIFVLPK